MGVHHATKNLQMNLTGDTPTSDQTYISTSQPAEYNNASDCDINTNCNIKNCDSLQIINNNNTSSQNCESPTIESRIRNPRRERRPDRAVYVPRHRRLNLSPTDNDNTPSNSINIENNKIISVSTSSSSKVTLQLAINEAEPIEPTKRNSQLCDIELIKENNSTNFNNISKEVKHLSSNNNINNSNKCNNSNNSTGSNIFTISVISDLKSNENSQPPLVTDSKNSPPKQNLNNTIKIEQHFQNQHRFKETDIFNMSRSVKCSPQELNHDTKLYKPPLECHINENITKSKKAYNKEIDDWDALYDDNGDCVDPDLNLSELTINIDKSQINERQKTETNRHSRTISSEEFPHVLEVSNFPVEFKTQDLMMLFTSYKSSGFDIKWVDDTHALAIFSSSKIAAEVLSQNHSFVSLKPLPDATMASRNKARKCAELLQPYRQRPETCVALARRLVTGALGVKLKTSKEELENERRILRNAKEKRILAAKLRDEVWEDC